MLYYPNPYMAYIHPIGAFYLPPINHGQVLGNCQGQLQWPQINIKTKGNNIHFHTYGGPSSDGSDDEKSLTRRQCKGSRARGRVNSPKTPPKPLQSKSSPPRTPSPRMSGALRLSPGTRLPPAPQRSQPTGPTLTALDQDSRQWSNSHSITFDRMADFVTLANHYFASDRCSVLILPPVRAPSNQHDAAREIERELLNLPSFKRGTLLQTARAHQLNYLSKVAEMLRPLSSLIRVFLPILGETQWTLLCFGWHKASDAQNTILLDPHAELNRPLRFLRSFELFCIVFKEVADLLHDEKGCQLCPPHRGDVTVKRQQSLQHSSFGLHYSLTEASTAYRLMSVPLIMAGRKYPFGDNKLNYLFLQNLAVNFAYLLRDVVQEGVSHLEALYAHSQGLEALAESVHDAIGLLEVQTFVKVVSAQLQDYNHLYIFDPVKTDDVSEDRTSFQGRPIAVELSSLRDTHSASFDILKHNALLMGLAHVTHILNEASRFGRGIEHALLPVLHQGQWLVVRFNMDAPDHLVAIEVQVFAFSRSNHQFSQNVRLNNVLRDYRSLAELLHVGGGHCRMHQWQNHYTRCNVPQHTRLELIPMSVIQDRPVHFDAHRVLLGPETNDQQGKILLMLGYLAFESTIGRHHRRDLLDGLLHMFQGYTNGLFNPAQAVSILRECLRLERPNFGQLRRFGLDIRDIIWPLMPP